MSYTVWLIPYDAKFLFLDVDVKFVSTLVQFLDENLQFNSHMSKVWYKIKIQTVIETLWGYKSSTKASGQILVADLKAKKRVTKKRLIFTGQKISLLALHLAAPDPGWGLPVKTRKIYR